MQDDESTLVSRTSDVERAENKWKKHKSEKDDDATVEVKSIPQKTLTWQKAAGLLFTEYIVIAILSFPESYSVLGMAGGLICTILVGLVTLYTSLVLWRYCLANPDLIDVCDIAYRLFGNSRLAYELAGIGFLLNNMFITGLHVLSGTIALNTISDHAVCTIVYSVILALVMFALSLFRTLRSVALMGYFAASTMFLALLLTWIFAGIESHPAGYTSGVPIIRAWAAPGTSFVTGLNASLNIVYTFIGQILLPSYISDMDRPEDFPKALYLVTFLEIILFALGGSILYWKFGDQYVTAPTYGSLQSVYAKAIAGFTLPTILIVGVLYSNVTSRYIFNRIYNADSVHRQKYTKKGWIVWILIVLGVWIVSWIISQAIPFFSLLLAIMSSLFDSYFGFIFWAVAFYRIHKGNLFSSPLRIAESILNMAIFGAGCFMFIAGTITSAIAIKDEYTSGAVGAPFNCADNGF